VRRLVREILDAIVVGIIVSAAIGAWWDRRLERKYGCSHG
jgi:hypothetical protein